MAIWRYYRCRKGHRWPWVAPPNVWPPDFRSSCPVCGDGPISWFVASGSIVGAVAAPILLFLAVGLAMIFLGGRGPFLIAGIALVFSAAATPAVLGAMWWVRRQRTKKMVAIAEQMGFAFVPYVPVPTIQAVAAFRLFTQTGFVSDGMQGRVGDCDVLVFDYQYVIGSSGRYAQVVSQTAVIFFDGAAGVPDFLLAPKAFFHKQVGLFAPRVIALEGAEEFDKRCALADPDEAALRQTFHPALVRRLGQDGQWFIEAANGQLLLYRSPKLPPERRPGLVTDALEIRDLLRGAGPPAAAEGKA